MNTTTHFWHRRGPFSERFILAVSDCKRLCQSEQFVDILAGWDGSGDPVFTNTQISFNGVDDDSGETFSVSKDQSDGIESCKTEHHPYDLAVRCCLLILRHHLSEEIEIGSNDRNSKKWNEALDIVNDFFDWDDKLHLGTRE